MATLALMVAQGSLCRREFCRSALGALLGAALPNALACEPPRTLRIATNVWPGYESMYVARRWGTLPSEVGLVELLSATQVLALMRTGVVDGGALTLDETLQLVSNGVPVRVVGVFDASAGADALIARRFTDLTGLRGASIGVENTALGGYFLSRVLEHAGLTTSDVRVVRLDVSSHEAAFRSGAVDAVITFDPVRQRLLTLGGHLVFDSRSLPDEILDVLAVHRDLLDDPHQRRNVAGVLRAVDRVVRKVGPGSTVFAAMAPRLSLTPAQVEASLRGVSLATLADMKRLLLGSHPLLEQRATLLGQRMSAAGLLKPRDSYDGLVDARALQEASA